MKKHINQRGYALLIVLFTIIIFLSLSAVFISASLNHATQEKTTDQINQAYVAAEMGVKKVSTDMKNEIDTRLNEINNKIKEQKILINNCQMNKTCNYENFQKEIAKLNVEETASFKKFVTTEMKVKFLGKYADNSIMQNQNVKFKLSNYRYEETNQKIQIFIDITGYSNNEKGQILSAVIELGQLNDIYSTTNSIPVSLEEQNPNVPINIFPGSTIEDCSVLLNKNLVNENKPYSCNLNEQVESLLTKINIKKMSVKDFNVHVSNFETYVCNGCSSSNLKDLFGLNLFVDGDVDLKNINNLKNAQLYIDGKFEAKNANNLGSSISHSYFIARTFDIKNNNGVTNTTIALLGFETGTSATFNYHNKFILSDDSKFCINLDRFTDSSKVNVSNIKGGGEVIYFAGNEYEFPEEPGGKNKKEIPTFTYINNFKTFLNTCGIDSYKMGGKIIYVPSMTENIPNSDVVNVKYN